MRGICCCIAAAYDTSLGSDRFGGLLGCWVLAPWGTILVPRRHRGRLWEQQGGHVGVWNRHFIDFGTIGESRFESFWAPRAKTMFFCSEWLPYHFVVILCIELGMVGTPESRFLKGRYHKIHFFARIEFW